MPMKSTTIHTLRITSGFALLGAVVAGALFGSQEHADIIRTVAAIVSVGLAKAWRFV